MKARKFSIRNIIFLVLAICWMGMIFYFSSRPADLSTEDSHRIGRLVGSVFVDGFSDMPWQDQLAFAEKIDYPIRKTAHALEYAVLGMLWYGALSGIIMFDTANGEQLVVNLLRQSLPSMAIAVLYAISDECHQLFVPGRAGKISDVLLDSTGAILGVLLLVLIIYCKKRREKCRFTRQKKSC